MCQSTPQSASNLSENEAFEFSSTTTGFDNNMAHAEDIIFCGKLITLRHDSLRDINSHVTKEEEEAKDGQRKRYVESKNFATQPNSPKAKVTLMSSKSFDHQQLRRSLSNDYRSAEIRRYSSARTYGRHDNIPGQKVNKPKWYSMLFGLVSKVPREMELREMKNRLVHRNPTTMFPQSDNKTIIPAKDSQQKSTWGLLDMLSCKYDASVDVNTSLKYLSHVDTRDNTYSHATCA